MDDDPTVADVVGRYLVRDGHTVECVHDGYEALRRVAEEPPDLVVLDLMLPGMDGLEVCRRLRARWPIPVVMLTALGDETDRLVGYEPGADDYVTKPFSPRELALRVRSVLRRSRGTGLPDKLDLGLPDVPGEAIVREVRADGLTPILMLTAKSTEEDRIRGLELGADDYVTKPFSPRELVLRVQAILRRGSQADTQGPVRYGGGTLVIDEPRREVRVRGERIDLTPTEWGILVALATVPGRVYSRFELINRVRGYEFEGYERTIDSHVKNLRHKIEADPADPAIVETVLGVGYRLGLARDG